jgi:flagellar biosynthesis chaperone FliJ
MHLPLLCAILILFSTSLIGCGDSQGVETLNAHLSEFSELIETYKTTVTEDKSKQAEWDARIEAMSAKWTDIRNEFGSDITPQKMDELVQQYDKLMLTLANFKKTIGS